MNSSPTTEALDKSGRVKVVHEGETVEAEELPFKVIAETRGIFETADGARITFDHSVKQIYRLCDRKKSDGSPIYLVTGQVTLNAEIPKVE